MEYSVAGFEGWDVNEEWSLSSLGWQDLGTIGVSLTARQGNLVGAPKERGKRPGDVMENPQDRELWPEPDWSALLYDAFGQHFTCPPESPGINKE